MVFVKIRMFIDLVFYCSAITSVSELCNTRYENSGEENCVNRSGGEDPTQSWTPRKNLSFIYSCSAIVSPA